MTKNFINRKTRDLHDIGLLWNSTDNVKKQQERNMKKSELQEFVKLIVESTIDEDSLRLRDVFLTPARDVVQTAGYAAERISAAAQKLVKGIGYIIPTIIIPGLSFDYKTFAKDEQVRLDQIKKKYGDVLERNWEAIKDPDVFGFLFLAYPESMLGFALMKRSPLAFLQILEVVTGGMDSVRQARERLEQTAAYSPRKRQNFDPAAGQWGFGGGNSYYGGDFGATGWGGWGESAKPSTSVILEEADPQTLQQLQALMNDPAVKQAIAASPMFKEMQGASIQIMTAPAARFMKAQNLDQMKGMVDPAVIEKAKQTIQANPDYQKADAQTKQSVINDFVVQVKTAYKQEYTKWLQGLAQQNPQAAPEIRAAISQINAMK